MKQIAIVFLALSLLGCGTVKKYWPRDHDPVMFNHLVELDRILEAVDCTGPDWAVMEMSSAHLAKYTEWRQDPQAENIKGLHAHVVRMGKGGSKTFCELGKKTAAQRIQAARSAWEGR
jgi:hypothetical protein